MFINKICLVVLSVFILSCTLKAEEPIKIAAIYSKTGVASVENAEFFDVVDFAVAEINKRGGVLGRRVRAIHIDNRSTPLGARQAAIDAVKQNVVGVVGACWSSFSLAMAPVLQEAGISMVSSASTNEKVTLVGDCIFRVCFTDAFQGKVMAQFAKEDMGAKTAVIFTNINSDYSMGLSDIFYKNFASDGGEVLLVCKYSETDVDFSVNLKKVLALKPDVMFIPGHEKDSAIIMKQSRNMGIKATFLGGDGWGDHVYDLVGDSVDGGYFSGAWHPDLPSKETKEFLKKYKDWFGKDAPCDQPWVFDATMVLLDAIRRAGSTDRKQVRDALADTKDFMAVTGRISFDENGDPIDRSGVILKFEKGKIVFVKSISPAKK